NATVLAHSEQYKMVFDRPMFTGSANHGHSVFRPIRD
ncbi:MAG: hypothetical protein ACI9CV_001763, partial [Ilumatobacter sp.]